MARHPTPSSSPAPAGAPSRRWILRVASYLGMLGGLVGGYGLLGWVSARFLLPAGGSRVRQLFVSRAIDIPTGTTLLYQTPDGRTVNITRRGTSSRAADFVALSSTCPHLGCQVRWEEQNGRYFCPCHNGTFDPSGKATGGPPGEAGLSLPRYALTVKSGLLFIDVSGEQLSLGAQARRVHVDGPQGPGHDPCLSSLRAPGGDTGDRTL